MKDAYINTLTDLMRKDKKLMTLTADMGYSVYEGMQKEFPERFINTGVTEQATISMASGMALTGFKVFVYAQAVFASMRCFEQVRLDIAYNNLDVKIIGVNAGFSLNQLGVSHFSVEDVGLMRLLPNMTIFSPGDPNEMKWALNKAYEINGPVYLRFSKLGNTAIHSKKINPKLGSPIKLSEGNDGTLFVSGGIIEIAKEALLELKKQKINIAFYSVPTVKPLNNDDFIKIIKQSKYIISCEEHNKNGGLGSAIGEIILDNNLNTPILKLGVEDRFTSITGTMDYLIDYNNLSKVKIIEKIKKFIKSK